MFVMTEELDPPCYRCGKPSVGWTSILAGTKEGALVSELDIHVCEECYTWFKERARTHKRIDED